MMLWCDATHDRDRVLDDMFEQLADWIMDKHPGAVYDGDDDAWRDSDSEGHDTVN